ARKPHRIAHLSSGQIGASVAAIGVQIGWHRALAFLRRNDRLLTFYPESDSAGNTIAQQRIQDGFALLDATVNQALWDRRIRLTFGAKNIFNVQQVNVAGGGGGAHSSNSGSLPVGLGRSFFVNMTLDLGF
ncbi:MAG: hypothetical protein AAF960_24900, partial [Bacteroidota bacterium]